MIDAFLAEAVLDATSSLVTGYDFLADAAHGVQAALVPGIVSTPPTR